MTFVALIIIAALFVFVAVFATHGAVTDQIKKHDEYRSTDADGNRGPAWLMECAVTPRVRPRQLDGSGGCELVRVSGHDYQGHEVAVARFQVATTDPHPDGYSLTPDKNMKDYTVVGLHLPGRWPFLEVQPRRNVAGAHNGGYPVIGWPPFDSHFLINTVNPAFAQAMFGPHRAPRYLQPDLSQMRWTLEGQALVVVIDAVLDSRTVQDIYSKLVTIAELIPAEVRAYHQSQ